MIGCVGVCADYQVKDSDIHGSILLNTRLLHFPRQFTFGIICALMLSLLWRQLFPVNCIMCYSTLCYMQLLSGVQFAREVLGVLVLVLACYVKTVKPGTWYSAA